MPCEFNAKYSRGRLPTIRSVDANEHVDADGLGQFDASTSGNVGCRNPETRPTTIMNQSSPQQEHTAEETVEAGEEVLPLGIVDASKAQSSRNSPEPSQTDFEGHYVGPSSGVSFMLRVQKRLHKIVSLSANSSIFTFGDAPLPVCDTSFFILPPKEKADALVARYFDFAVPTHRFLHRPTVQAWADELYANLGSMQDQKGEMGKKAVIFMVFAQAEEYMSNSNSDDSGQR